MVQEGYSPENEWQNDSGHANVLDVARRTDMPDSVGSHRSTSRWTTTPHGDHKSERFSTFGKSEMAKETVDNILCMVQSPRATLLCRGEQEALEARYPCPPLQKQVDYGGDHKSKRFSASGKSAKF